MAMIYATITGTITRPGSNVGVRSRITATPLTTNQALTFTGDDRITIGPETAETNGSGTLSTLKIPTNVDVGALLWRITAEALDRGPGPSRWTVKNAVAITGSSTIKLKDLVEVDVITVDAAIVTNVSALVADADSSKTAAAGSATAAAGSASAAATSASAAAGSATGASGSASAAATSASTASTKAGEASGSATAAAGSASAAAASASHADAMAGAAEAVAVSNDTIIAGRINDSASATAAALTASIDERTDATVPGLVADALAADNTPALAAAAAVDAALEDADVVVGDPSATAAWGLPTPATPGRRMAWNAADTDGTPFPETITLLQGEMLFQAQVYVWKTVGPSGDFTGPVAAAAWALTQPRSLGRWIGFIVEDGVYDIASADLDWRVPEFVVFRARRTWGATFRGDGGQDQPDSVVNTKSTVYMRDTGQLSGIVVTAKNLRYAIHSDDAGTNVNTTVVLSDGVRAIHYGNAEAVAWRTANPGSGLSAGTVLTARPAWGQGTASGQKTKLIDADLRGTDAPVLFHNNLNFIAPAVVEMERCTLTGYNTATGVPVQSLGSGTPDLLRMKDCSMLAVPLVKQTDDIWRPDTLARQVADHREWHIVLDNTLAGYWPSLRGRALRVVSAGTGTGSKVRFTGTAVPVLIGTETDRDGGGGLAGYAYGSLDMSNITVGWNGTTAVANNLGKRLGDRTSAPVTLTITTEAGSADVVFNANHNSQSDATVLGLINTALGSLGTASLYDVAASEYYPDCCERQTVAYNATATGIPQWSVVAWDGSPGKVQVAPTTATLDTIAGVALEPIPPGGSGRVLRAGIMLNSQLLGGFAVSHGQPVYLSDSTAGRVTATVGTGRVFGRGIGNAFLTRFDTRTTI